MKGIDRNLLNLSSKVITIYTHSHEYPIRYSIYINANNSIMLGNYLHGLLNTKYLTAIVKKNLSRLQNQAKNHITIPFNLTALLIYININLLYNSINYLFLIHYNQH